MQKNVAFKGFLDIAAKLNLLSPYVNIRSMNVKTPENSKTFKDSLFNVSDWFFDKHDCILNKFCSFPHA